MAERHPILFRAAPFIALALALYLPAGAAIAAPLPDKIAPPTIPHPVPSGEAIKPKREHPNPCNPKDYPTQEAVAMCLATWAASSVKMVPK